MSADSSENKENGSKRKQAKGRKTTYFLAATIVLAAAGFFGGRYYLYMISNESTEDAFVEAHVVSISPQVSGHVARVLARDNQEVKKGELLVELNPQDYQVALDIAQSHLASAEAAKNEGIALMDIAQNKLDGLNASLNSDRADLAQAQAGVAEVEAGADRDRDELDLGRIKQIADAGAVSKQEYDHARAQASISRAKVNSAQKEAEAQAARIEQTKASILAAENELKQAHAQLGVRAAALQEARAEVEQARLNLSYTRITAPCDGYVTKKALEPGAFVQEGEKLFNIVSHDAWIIANFKETQIAGMRPGQPVEVKVDAYPDVVFKGHVDSIQRGTGSRFTLLPPENASGNFIKVVQRVPVKIVLETPGPDLADGSNGTPLLAPGMSVIPTVKLGGPDATGLSAERASDLKTAVE